MFLTYKSNAVTILAKTFKSSIQKLPPLPDQFIVINHAGISNF